MMTDELKELEADQVFIDSFMRAAKLGSIFSVPPEKVAAFVYRLNKLNDENRFLRRAIMMRHVYEKEKNNPTKSALAATLTHERVIAIEQAALNGGDE